MIFGVTALIVAFVALFLSVISLALSAIAYDRWRFRRADEVQE